jgi:hypothetical protein
MEDKPEHEKLKLSLVSKSTSTSSYLGSHIREELMKTDFKVLKGSCLRPTEIRKGDALLLPDGAKTRPVIVCKVLKDRTILYIALTSTKNVHCMTPHNSRFFKEGCFSKSFSVCTEETAIEAFIGIFDDMKSLNQAIKDLKEFINKSI